MVSTLQTIKIDSAMCWRICVMFCLMAVILAAPDLAWAATNDPGGDGISNTLCKIVNILTGRAGKGIATIGVIFLGIGLFMGKMSWATTLAVGLGIGAIFGAASIVNSISDDKGASCQA